MNKKLIFEYIKITLGSIIFAACVNIFIIPYGLYNGGIVGTAQLIRTILEDYMGLAFNFDIAGIINLVLNIPLFILAYYKLNKQFLFKSIYSVIIQTIAFSIIPISSEPLIGDIFASTFIGGALSSLGVVIILVARGSTGGNDITSMLVMKHNPNITVGKFGLYYNLVVYSICFVLFDAEIAIYSILQAYVFTVVVDKRHLQNIPMSVMIFTKNKAVKQMIIKEQNRGVTYWKGQGAYTDSETEVLVTIVSKYEIKELEYRIKQIDPQAFVIVQGQAQVSGNLERRLY